VLGDVRILQLDQRHLRKYLREESCGAGAAFESQVASKVHASEGGPTVSGQNAGSGLWMTR
jgi:hypothetical protein